MNQGNSPNIDNVSDLENFEETVNAFSLLGFSNVEQTNIFKVLASILHLGNIKFEEMLIKTENEQDQEGCGISVGTSKITFIYIFKHTFNFRDLIDT